MICATPIAPAGSTPVAAGTIRGLVLAGGASRRMGCDKAAIDYHGIAQLRHAQALLASVTGVCHIAIRGEPRDPLRQSLPWISDVIELAGPAAGLLAAQRRYPQVSWLLVACDMPLLTPALLQALCQQARREPLAEVIAYAAGDGAPEPLCALWRPATRPRLEQLLQRPAEGLRTVAMQCRPCLLTPADPAGLRNANTLAEADQIRAQLQFSTQD